MTGGRGAPYSGHEELIAFLGSQLPTPVERETAADGSMIFTGGTPPEVVAQLTDRSVIISAYAGTWTAPDRFAVRPRRVGLVKWRRLPETPMMNAISALIKGARDVRLATYRQCRICEKKHAPETLIDDVCAWCHEEPPSVVH